MQKALKIQPRHTVSNDGSFGVKNKGCNFFQSIYKLAIRGNNGLEQ